MPKIPDNLPVKVTVSKITLEVPKSFFEQYALRAAIFVGRKGCGASTRRTKWFTLADPSLVPSRKRQTVALPSSHLAGSHRASIVAGGEGAEEQQHDVEEVPVDMAVLEYSGINNVIYEVDMKPLNIFEGDWVFDQKTTHPLSIFAKILMKSRPGVRINNAVKSEQESNLNEMLQMDQDDMESEEHSDSDNFSNEGGESGVHDDPALEMSLSGVGLTEAQMAALSGEENSHEMVMNQLRRGREYKKRYLQFPKAIDMATIVNTKAKTADYCERLMCKNAALLGTTLSFTVTAELPLEKLSKFEDRVKSKEDKEELRLREKEEKALEKERKRVEKEERKHRQKEEKKVGKKTEKMYGTDVTEIHNTTSAKSELKVTSQLLPVPDSSKKKSGFAPFELVKGIFSKEAKPEMATPFAVKLSTTPFPYLIMLYDFQLSKLVKEPENYRAVHIRLGTDSVSVEKFPRLLLDATKPSARTESTFTWYDGSVRNAVTFSFGTSHIFFGDKAIRHITGFETLRALQEHEMNFHEAKKEALEGSVSQQRDPLDGELFHEQLMNVGTQFHPITFEPTKYSANGNQAITTKYTRVTAQLIVAEKVIGEVRPSDEEEKREYMRRLKKQQLQKEKEERDRLKAEKEAAKVAKSQVKKDSEVAGAASADANVELSHNSLAATTASSNDKNDPAKPSSASSANHASSNAAKNSNEGSSAGEEGEEKPTFTAGAAEHLDANEKDAATSELAKKEDREHDGSKIVLNKSSSFQLSTYMINEDYMPKDGLQYRILFQTGEELTFRARRFFLPSVCQFGDEGNRREQTLGEYLNSASD